MDNKYYEKGNFKILKKCESFARKNSNVTNNHAIGSKALKLSNKLLGSLLRSQRSFDNRIRTELKQINSCPQSLQQQIYIYQFNQKNICLVLDVESHKAIDDLNIIINNNF